MSLLRRLTLLSLLIPALAAPAFARKPQETGFLNRTLLVNGLLHRYQVYVPEGYDPRQKWPIILFLHGSGERGSEGMDETQIGLPAAIRLHPERWPAIVVMPQVPFNHHHWTDPDMMSMAFEALTLETREFQGDPQRTYLTGLSLGGYGVWEIARAYPHTFAAIVPVCGGIFWSYQPQRWQQSELPAEYARILAHTPAWIFHGADDNVVSPRQSILMFEAMKAAGANVRFWLYEHVRHNVWERAYSEPELPRWLFSHHLSQGLLLPAAAERVLVPIHPVPAKINPALYDAFEGEYLDLGVSQVTLYRQGDQLFQRNRVGDTIELLPESANTFFFASGGTMRLTFERDSAGQVRGLRIRDDRHEDFWEKKH
ncbi:MAG TPA: prolyl oligopeptidase family serine peptidase [Acidobacteriaceae bacterium]